MAAVSELHGLYLTQQITSLRALLHMCTPFDTDVYGCVSHGKLRVTKVRKWKTTQRRAKRLEHATLHVSWRCVEENSVFDGDRGSLLT